MIDREKRLELDKFFERKKELSGWIKYNIDLVDQYKKASRTEEHERTFKHMKAKIKFGNDKISLQKKELLELSVPKISRKTGISYHTVKYHEMVFNRAMILL